MSARLPAMLKDITLGQYFPGKTVIHRLDPRTKLVLVIVYIVALFLARNFISYGVVLIFLIAIVEISHIRLRVILNSLRPLLFVIILTAVLNLFYSGGTPIVQFWIFKISKEGIVNAAFMNAANILKPALSRGEIQVIGATTAPPFCSAAAPASSTCPDGPHRPQIRRNRL